MPDRTAHPGRTYRHFKGGLYRVLFEAKHSETDEPLVVYEALPDRGYFVRPLAMFLDHVDRDGYQGPRFVEIFDPFPSSHDR
ncbi:DUF1653 domain-containing protein [Singulisphaera rosea]